MKGHEFSIRDKAKDLLFTTKRGHALTGSGATLRLPEGRNNYTDHDLLQQLSLPGIHMYYRYSDVIKESDYKVNVWG
jgi:hypothetical protein